MPFLLLIVLSLTCLQTVWPKPPDWLGAWGGACLTWTGTVAILGFAGFVSYRFRRQLSANPDHRSKVMRRFGKCRRFQLYLLLSYYFLALYGLGWGWIIKQQVGTWLWFLPGLELMILAPFLAGLVFSWYWFYDVERVMYEINAAGDTDLFLGRWTYVGLQARHNLLLVVPPLLLLLVQQTVLRLFPSLQQSTWFMPVFGVTLLVGAFTGIPYVLRLLLGLKPLPDGPTRQQLLATAERLQFRFNDILIWNTRNTVANAMVTGPTPFLRYVVLTDRLIDELTADEIEAVFGHEVGHIKHHHMVFYLGFLMSSMVLMAGLWKLVESFLQTARVQQMFQQAPWLAWFHQHEFLAVIPVLAGLAIYIFVVFGFLSRRCERQADIYGCRAASCMSFINALEKVGYLNGIHRENPGWLSWWQHSTIAKRVEFLLKMDLDPHVETVFQRRVGWLKWGCTFGLTTLMIVVYLAVYLNAGPQAVMEIFRDF